MEDGASERGETRKRQRRREEIFASAIAIFNEKGYTRTSVQEIAESVGVLKGSLYYYIDSKEDLLVEIFDQTDREFLELIERAFALDVSEVERLHSFARAWCLWYLENIERARVYVNDWIHLGEGPRAHVAKMRKEYGRKVQGLIDGAVGELALEPVVDPHHARLYIFSAVNGLPLWYRRGGVASAEQIATDFARLIVGTVLSAAGSLDGSL